MTDAVAVRPPAVRLRVQVERACFRSAVGRVLAVSARCGLPVPAAGVDDVLDEIARDGEFQFYAMTGDYFLVMSAAPDEAYAWIDAIVVTSGMSDADFTEAVEGLSTLLYVLYSAGGLVHGWVRRRSGSSDGPVVAPLAADNVAVVVHDIDVAETYTDPRAFFRAWRFHRHRAGLHYLTRAKDAVSASEWFNATFRDEWSLARAARVGSVRFGANKVPPGVDEQLFRAGASCLRQAGYRGGQVELSACVPKGRDIPAWEVLHWNEILVAGRLDDGSPVQVVRAVFGDRASARRHARPLLGIGMKVVYRGRDGRYHGLPDDI